MRFEKLLTGAVAGWIGFVSPVSAQNVNSVVNICEVAPDGSVHTVHVTTLGSGAPFTLFFTNMASQQPSVANWGVASNSKKLALVPGTYSLKFWHTTGNNPVVRTWPTAILVRPYVLTAGQGTGCALNVPPKIGNRAERVPSTPLPQ